ncbi:UNVERIFIED_CONTAM: hypothetical protein BEN50_02800 [Euhalothece sp. KZN 001]
MLLLTASPTQAELGVEPQEPQPSSWSGTWQDQAGTVMTIREHNGFLDILGKEDQGGGTTYNVTCLIKSDLDKAECVGEGYYFAGTSAGTRLLYRSTLSLEASGEIKETWKVSFPNDEREGIATFKKTEETPSQLETR